MTSDVQRSKEIQAHKEKRDMFAAAALTGIISAVGAQHNEAKGTRKNIDFNAYYAQAAFKVADAMLKERG